MRDWISYPSFKKWPHATIHSVLRREKMNRSQSTVPFTRPDHICSKFLLMDKHQAMAVEATSRPEVKSTRRDAALRKSRAFTPSEGYGSCGLMESDPAIRLEEIWINMSHLPWKEPLFSKNNLDHLIILWILPFKKSGYLSRWNAPVTKAANQLKPQCNSKK